MSDIEDSCHGENPRHTPGDDDPQHHREELKGPVSPAHVLAEENDQEDRQTANTPMGPRFGSTQPEQ
jgi:hypothetical protein